MPMGSTWECVSVYIGAIHPLFSIHNFSPHPPFSVHLHFINRPPFGLIV